MKDVDFLSSRSTSIALARIFRLFACCNQRTKQADKIPLRVHNTLAAVFDLRALMYYATTVCLSPTEGRDVHPA